MTKKGSVVRQEFYVKLMRPVFQIAVIAIKAETAEEAASIALEQARDLKETQWRGRFDPKHYTYDVQDVIDPLEEHGDSATAKRRRLQNQLSATPAESIRYLLLKADVDYGEGSMLMPPWLAAQGALMILDLASDWREAIETIEEHGPSGY